MNCYHLFRAIVRARLLVAMFVVGVAQAFDPFRPFFCFFGFGPQHPTPYTLYPVPPIPTEFEPNPIQSNQPQEDNRRGNKEEHAERK